MQRTLGDVSGLWRRRVSKVGRDTLEDEVGSSVRGDGRKMGNGPEGESC
jgi:hypothetical protein